MGRCLLMNFRNGGTNNRFEDWAKEHLITTQSSIPSKGTMTWLDWTKKYFTTTKDSIPAPASSTYDGLVAWAKLNFLMTSS